MRQWDPENRQKSGIFEYLEYDMVIIHHGGLVMNYFQNLEYFFPKIFTLF